MKNEKIKLTKFKNGCEERKKETETDGGGGESKSERDKSENTLEYEQRNFSIE